MDGKLGLGAGYRPESLPIYYYNILGSEIVKRAHRYLWFTLVSNTFFLVLAIVRLTWDIATHGSDSGTYSVMIVFFGVFFLVTLIRIINLIGP